MNVACLLPACALIAIASPSGCEVVPTMDRTSVIVHPPDGEQLAPLQPDTAGIIHGVSWTLKTSDLQTGLRKLEYAPGQGRIEYRVYCGAHASVYDLGGGAVCIIGEYSEPQVGGWLRMEVIKRDVGTVLRYDTRQRLLGTEGLPNIPDVRLVARSRDGSRVYVLCLDKGPRLLCPRLIGLDCELSSVFVDKLLTDVKWGYFQSGKGQLAPVAVHESLGGRVVVIEWCAEHTSDSVALTVIPVCDSAARNAHVVCSAHASRVIDAVNVSILNADSLRYDRELTDEVFQCQARSQNASREVRVRYLKAEVAPISVDG